MNSKETNLKYNILYNQNVGIYHKIVKHYNLSECQFWILYALNVENKPLSQSELCAYLISPKQTIHSSIQKLILDGYITLKETTGKKKMYFLTNTGKKLSNKTVRNVIQIEERLFETFSEKERKDIIHLFQKYNDTLEKLWKEEI